MQTAHNLYIQGCATLGTQYGTCYPNHFTLGLLSLEQLYQSYHMVYAMTFDLFFCIINSFWKSTRSVSQYSSAGIHLPS